jgi:alanine racemase
MEMPEEISQGCPERSTQAVINLQAIEHNITEIRKRVGTKRELLAVVKANGYGHGAIEVSRVALRSGANCLGVALPEEGGQLRKAGIDAPILVLGLIQPEEAAKVVDFRLVQNVSSLEVAEALDQEAGKAAMQIPVHIKVDTGMGRIGIKPEETLAFVRKILQYRNLKLEGVFSHFSCADEADLTFARKQLEVFNNLVREIESVGIHIPKKHFANSAAILVLPEAYFDMVRPGISIYGLYPSPEVRRTIPLQPAMTFKTKIALLKFVPAGTPISYGRTYYTQRDTLVATLAVGYADGYSRLLSNQGSVRIKGRRAPVIGRVCMDMIMVDVSAIPDVHPGEEVILFGEDPSVEEIAQKTGTINYEVLCGISQRVPRIYIRE